MASSEEYPKTARNKVNRKKNIAQYDYETIHTLINTAPLLHVSFPTDDPDDPFPATLPMLGFMGLYMPSSSSPDTSIPTSLAQPLDLYIHGDITSRLMKLGSSPPSIPGAEQEQEGLPVTVSATHLDGIVHTYTPFNHSCNYRSAVVQGYAVPVTDREEKFWAMRCISEGVVDGMWDRTRVPPREVEMGSTQILKITPIFGSAKIRTGGPHDDREDLKDEDMRSRVWNGVIPTWRVFGEPVPTEHNRVRNGGGGGGLGLNPLNWLQQGEGSKASEYITSFIREQNRRGEEMAKAALVERNG